MPVGDATRGTVMHCTRDAESPSRLWEPPGEFRLSAAQIVADSHRAHSNRWPHMPYTSRVRWDGRPTRLNFDDDARASWDVSTKGCKAC